MTSLFTVNRLTDDGTFAYTYDDEGNRLTKVRKSGAAADDKTVEYTWDQRNRLSTVTFKRNDGTITKSVTYTYDAFDRMTKRVLDPDGNLGSATLVTEEYFWDGDEIVHTRSSVAGESHYYMIDPNSGDVLFDQKGSTVYVTLSDHLGTVRDLVNVNGQVVNHLVYDAFGNRKSETNPQGGAVPFSPQMGFTGQWFDMATGLQYNHHRWYDPATGQWLSEDPIGFDAGDGNLYRYVGNGATSFVDPVGLSYSFHHVPGYQNGQSGTFVHKYDEGPWYWPWATPVYMSTVFIPNAPNKFKLSADAINTLNKRNQNDIETNCVAGGHVQDTADAIVAIAIINIPGPEEVILAAAGRLGYELVKHGGRWAIKAGGKLLSGADESAAAARIGNEVALAGKQCLQTGGHTITNATAKALGLTPQQAKNGLEKLRALTACQTTITAKSWATEATWTTEGTLLTISTTMSSEPQQQDDNLFKVGVSFGIAGPTVDPTEVTKSLGVRPTAAIAVGDEFVSHGRTYRRARGVWGITSDEHVTSHDVNQHLEYLLSVLEQNKREIERYCNIPEVDVLVRVWLRPTSTVVSVGFNSGLLARLSAISQEIIIVVSVVDKSGQVISLDQV